MAMLGTGANMQCNRYFPGHYSTLDLNVVANGSSWTLTDDVKFFNSGHCYDIFSSSSSSSAEQHLECNKEVLKQTMLKHEAIFKDQIYELHRIYRRQKLLMDEIKNGLDKDRLPLETSHSNPVSHIPSGHVPKRCSLPWLNPVCSQTSVSAVDNIPASAGFNGGKRKQVGPDAAQPEDRRKDSDLMESKNIKSRKIMFDLELPADAYINRGEGEPFEEENVHMLPATPIYSCETACEVVNYSTPPILRSGGLDSVSQGGTGTPNSLSRIINCITDLNKPIKLEVESDAFLGSANNRDIFLTDSIDFSGNTNSGCQTVCKEMTGELTHVNLTSFPQGACAGNLLTSSQSEHVQFKETLGCPTSSLLDETSRKSQIENAIFALESSGKNHDFFVKNHLGSFGNFGMPSSQLVPEVDSKNSVCASNSSGRDSMHDIRRNPIAVQALPCFANSVKLAKSSKPLISSKELARDRFHLSNSSPDSERETFLQGGLSHVSQSESNTPEASPLSASFELACKHHSPPKHVKGLEPIDAKCAKGMNLNLTPESSSQDVAVSQGVQVPDGKMKLAGSMSGLPRNEANQSYKGKSGEGMEGSAHLEPGFSQAYSDCFQDIESRSVEESSNGSIKRIFENPIVDKFPVFSDQCSSHASPSSSHQDRLEVQDIEMGETYGEFDVNLGSEKQRFEDEGVEIGFKSNLPPYRHCIDLNSCINQGESPAICLEAPVSPENKECSPTREDSDDNQLELLGHGNVEVQQDLVRTAVEALVFISTSAAESCEEKANSDLSEVSFSESLYWFAGIVSSSMTGDVKNCYDHKKFPSDEIDYFEAMTLQLTETKVEEYWQKSNGQTEERTHTMALQNQVKRVRTRRGRQRKDFQNEVLPGIASLSRNEVTEDLQTIGGLIDSARAQGTGLARYVGRNGWARGKRRSCIPYTNATESLMGSPVKQKASDGKLGLAKSLISWGKMSRRRRGQRQHPASKAAKF